MLNDLKFALRQLRKSPGFAVTAILTLALGIGVNTAMFSLVDSILLRSLPFPHSDRLMSIGYGGSESAIAFFPKGWVRALNEHSNSFASISGFGPNTESNVGDSGSPDRVFGAEVMTNALNTLDVSPALGRFFSPEDARSGHDPVVVLNYGYWREHFGASSAVIGKTIRIDGISRRVIGVLPANIRFPYADTQFLIPVTFKGGDPLDPWQTFDLRIFGRLKAGVAPLQAQAELRRLQPELLPLFPWRMPDIWARNMTVISMLDSMVGNLRARLLLLLGAVGLVLLVACGNVANLMLARAAGREREIAIRGALGASGARLARQLLSESVLIGMVAGGAGLAAAALSLQVMAKLLPADTPRLNTLGLHWHTFLFAVGISVVTGLLFGLVPALRMASPNLQGTLQSGSRGIVGKTSHFRAAMLLVMGQIGLSVVVITGAGLMLHSLYSLSRIDPGFQTDRILSAEVSMDSTACQTPPEAQSKTPTGAVTSQGRCQAFFQTLLDRLHGLPGEENVALTDSLPLDAVAGNYVYDAEGHPREARQGALLATGRIVSPGYFETLGIRLVQGRLLDEQDASGASRAVVIDEAMAQRLWPHENPLGRHILNVNDEPEPAVWNSERAVTVVGVVSNTREGSLSDAFGDEVYLPMTPARQNPTMYILLHTRATTQEATKEIRSTVAAVDPQIPVTRVTTLNEVIAASESASRSLAVLLLGFGALAVVIGSLGVYSLIAYIVSWRTREIGIRLALGAQRGKILCEVVGRSLMLAAGGAALGLIAAAAATRLLHSFLFGISPLDPITFLCAPLFMLLLAILAAWIPARRASRIDPMEALRGE